MALTRYIYPKGFLNIGKGLIPLHTSTFKIMLLKDYTYDAAHELVTSVSSAEIAATGGYTAGGFALSSVTWAVSGMNVKFDAADLNVSSGITGPFPAFNGYVIYQTAGNYLLAYADLGQNYDPANSDQLVVPFGAGGIFNWAL